MHLHASRRRASNAGVAEALSLLRDLDPEAPAGGPLSEQGGLFWITVPPERLAPARERLARLGYTAAVDLVLPEGDPRPPVEGTAVGSVRWRRRTCAVLRIYEHNPLARREGAPDRRLFLYETGAGEVRPVRGYRGSEAPLTHRALPVSDARLLANLVYEAPPGVLLDLFAGAGAVVLEALANGWRVVSADIDVALRHGLAHLGARHVVADARALPLMDGTMDAAATEPPYDRATGGLMALALAELARVVRREGRIAILCAGWQAAQARAAAAELGLRSYLDTAIERRGTEVVALAWQRT
jgi:SAM-dependent methyltransferase